ncbi:TPA: hypothetical protein ACGO0F_002162 [Streptococcus suis]
MDESVLIFLVIAFTVLMVTLRIYIDKWARSADEKSRHRKRLKREQNEQLNKREKL